MLQKNEDSGKILFERENRTCTPSLLAKTAFYYAQSMGHSIWKNNYFCIRQDYRSILMVYTVSGNGYLKYRNKEYLLQKGQMFLINCYDLQEYYVVESKEWEIKWLHFYGSNSEDYFNIIYNNYGPVIEIGECVQDKLTQMVNLIAAGDLHFEVKASSIILEMLTEIFLKASEKNAHFEGKNQYRVVGDVIGFIEEKYSTPISVTDMASVSGYSMHYFIRLFKKITGYSPYEYLTKYRIGKAKGELSLTDKSVEEISTEIGFDSVSNFIKTFKALESMTPLKYRTHWKL